MDNNMKIGFVMINALARHVHANGMRHQATGRVRDAEKKYDRAFKGAKCLIEDVRHSGEVRLWNMDQTMCFNLKPEHEGRIFTRA